MSSAPNRPKSHNLKGNLSVTETTRPRSTTSLGSAYNSFLFASISDDAGAAPLNTVSVLARLDIDPWQEAAELSCLPKESAIQRLADLLVRMPDRPIGLPDAEVIATRLVALLPGSRIPRASFASPTINSGRTFNPTSVAIGFGCAIAVLVSGLLQAASIQMTAQTAVKPPVSSNAHPPAAPRSGLRR
jgi:hypothetical protein